MIYCDEGTRRKLFALIEADILREADRSVAGCGVDLWRILVLSVLKRGLGCDFDHLQELANQHSTLREMLGHGAGGMDDFYYERRYIMNNVALVPVAVLREINRLVVSTGHEVSRKLAWRKVGRAM